MDEPGGKQDYGGLLYISRFYEDARATRSYGGKTRASRDIKPSPS